jgi:phosphoribosylformylglycinamidine synthase
VVGDPRHAAGCATTPNAPTRSDAIRAPLRCAGPAAAADFDPAEDIAAPFINTGARPRVAILREQGVNGQVEMAAAFDRAGFEPSTCT